MGRSVRSVLSSGLCPPSAPPAIFWLIRTEGLGWESELSGPGQPHALAESTPLPQMLSAPRPSHTHLQGLPHPLSWAQPPRDLAGGMAGGRTGASHSLTPEALLWGPGPGPSLGESWAGAGLHSRGGGGSGGG